MTSLCNILSLIFIFWMVTTLSADFPADTYIKYLQNFGRKPANLNNFDRPIKNNNSGKSTAIPSKQTEDKIKRDLREKSPEDLKQYFEYFSQNEDRNKENIYKNDSIYEKLQSGEYYAVQNIGHSTILIQVAFVENYKDQTLNIIIDPVFGREDDATTDSYPKTTIADLPLIDVILISQNHPNHLDVKSVKEIIDKNPGNTQLFTPFDVGVLFRDLDRRSYHQIMEFNWYMAMQFGYSSEFRFISIPSTLRPGRDSDRFGWTFRNDIGQMSVGWIINPTFSNVIFKYSGDIKQLGTNEQNAIDYILMYEILKMFPYGENDLPHIICIEPAGPTYTRKNMAAAHQSPSYSVLLKFIDAHNLATFFNKPILEILEKHKTVMVNHNKFELGPDRFNEALFVASRLYQYVDMGDEQRKIEHAKEKEKLDGNWDKKLLTKMFPDEKLLKSLPKHSSILIHANDFIFDEISSVEKTTGLKLKNYMEYITNNTVFPKIGERLSSKDFNSWRFQHLQPENIPDYPLNRKDIIEFGKQAEDEKNRQTTNLKTESRHG